jgi:catechol 2,3-dioxygenase-like lactoylglutathione lyase family enzyme
MATLKAKKTSRATRKKGPRAAHKARRSPAKVQRRDPATLRLRSLSPALTVNDLEKSLAFYTDGLGFIVSERWTDDAGKLRGVMLKAGTCEIGLTQDDWVRGRERKKGQGVRVWCETAQDIDLLATRVKQAGFALTEGPMELPWGGRAISIDDLDGYHLSIFREE